MSPRTLPSLGRIDSSIVIPSDQVAAVRALVQASRSVPIPETPEALIEEAGRLRERAEWHERMARASRQQAESFEALAGVRGKRGLTSTHPIGTIVGTQMEAQSPTPGANISAAKTKGRWPFQQALIKRNLSLPEWARAQKKPNLIEIETAKSWLKKPTKGGRKIPREWADRIEAEFREGKKSEVPAVNASWPSGIRED